MTLTPEEILAADDIPQKVIDVPEWGGKVIVRALSGEARDAYEDSLWYTDDQGTRTRDLSNMRAKLAIQGLYKEDGSRMFTARHIAALGTKNAGVLDRIWDEITKLSLMGPDGMVEASGNSEAAPSGGSTSDSPETSD